MLELTTAPKTGNGRSVGEKYLGYREIIATSLITEFMKRLVSGEILSKFTKLPTAINSEDLDLFQVPLVYMGENEYHIGDSALDLGGTQITWKSWEADLKHQCFVWANEQKSIRELYSMGIPTHLARICRHPENHQKIPLEQFHYFLNREGMPKPEYYIDGFDYWVYNRHVKEFFETGVFDHNLEIIQSDLAEHKPAFPNGMCRPIAIGQNKVKPIDSFRNAGLLPLNTSHLDL